LTAQKVLNRYKLFRLAFCLTVLVLTLDNSGQLPPVQAAVFVVRSNIVGIAEAEKAIREFKKLRRTWIEFERLIDWLVCLMT
jgi:hypothetical protein